MSKDPETSRTPAGLSLDRTKALTDGVVAIAITILVLDLEVPEGNLSEQGLLAFLKTIEGTLHPYLASFALIAAYWVDHSIIHRYVRRGTSIFIWLNVLFLLPLSLVPFVTQLRNKYPTDAIAESSFGVVSVACCLVLLVLWRYGTTHCELVPARLDPRATRSFSLRILASVVLTVAGVCAAILVSEHLGTLLFLGIPVIHGSHRFAAPPRAEGETMGSGG